MKFGQKGILTITFKDLSLMDPTVPVASHGINRNKSANFCKGVIERNIFHENFDTILLAND